MKVLITGGSHTAAIDEGLGRLRAAGRLPDGLETTVVPLGGALADAGQFFESRGDQVVIVKDSFRRRIPRLSRRETPFDAIGFCSPYHSRGIWMSQDWQRYGLPSPGTGDRIPISQALVRRCIGEHNAHLVAFLKALRDIGFPVLAIEGPRPFRHNPEVELAGARAVSWVDQAYRRHTRAVLDELGIASVYVPENTVDADGFTLPAFRHQDPTDTHHANGDFGERLAAVIVERLARAL